MLHPTGPFRTRVLGAMAGILAFVCLVAPVFPAELTLKNSPVQVYFSPDGGAQEAIVDVIVQARSAILVQAYSFTSRPIAEALRKAFKRGVTVEAILDTSQRDEKYSGATFLHNAGISVTIDDEHAIAHNKVMVIDNAVVITGSFNFTKAAETKNAENVLVIHDSGLAKLYAENWQTHRKHSAPYDGPALTKEKKHIPGTFESILNSLFRTK